MTPPPASHVLDVPGARLHYEVWGSGPAVMLVGHPMGASGFAGLAALLAEDHTIVTHDPRGFARSTIEDADQDAEPDVLAEDALRVLEAVGEDRVHLFGSSGGAVTGLALAANHPGRLATLVVHEPPLALLLADAEEAVAGIREVHASYLERGVAAAWEEFSSFTGIKVRAPGDGGSEPPPPTDRVAPGERFFRHGLLPITLYRPDLEALGSTTVRVAGGSASRGQFAQRTAVALASLLGVPLNEFPGGHTGFVSDPEDFAESLRRLLA